MALPHSLGPDSIQAKLAGKELTGVFFTRKDDVVSVRIEPPVSLGEDTLSLSVWGLGIRYRTVALRMVDRKAIKVFDSTNPVARILVQRLDSLQRIDPSLNVKTAFLERLGAGLAQGDSALHGWEISLPEGLSVAKGDSAALWYLATHGMAFTEVKSTWLATLDSLSVSGILRGWLNAGRITKQQQDAVLRSETGPVDPVLPVKDSVAPFITWISPEVDLDTVPDTTKSFLIRALVTDAHLSTVTWNGGPAVGAGETFDVRVSLEQGAITLVVLEAKDSAGNTTRDSVRIFRPFGTVPTVERKSPERSQDSVSDLVSTYRLSWNVLDDDLDSVTIDGVPVLLQGVVATKEVGLESDRNSLHVLRAVDRLRHEILDTVRVYRAASVPPVIQLILPSQSGGTVPDTQSFVDVSWSVMDSNLSTVAIDGHDEPASPLGGTFGKTIFLAPGTKRVVRVEAIDQLGSRSIDSLVIERPDPRAPWQEAIATARSRSKEVPLSDELRPGLRFGRFEVSLGLFRDVLGDSLGTDSSLPATHANIYEAMYFCNELSKASGLDTFYTYSSIAKETGFLGSFGVRSDTLEDSRGVLRRGFRLPTPEEHALLLTQWGGPYAWGSSTDTALVNQYAVWSEGKALPVGSRSPTGTGVFDLAGNASEWVYSNRGNLDEYTNWMVRGGSFTDASMTDPLVESRWILGTTRSSSIGFRIVRVGAP
ncbi:MAG: SUMF1/EgtB/PvdO family nonheme iron enzyme [Fibrobacteria bacterium]|nr:SUMF1/EgtB/PvdO family nonheme iron enzyme [Fibrobacteria bacterium]